MSRLLVEKYSSGDFLERQLSDPFCGPDTFIMLRSNSYSSSSGKTALREYIREGYYHSNLPDWKPRNKREPAFFSDQYFLFDQDVLAELLTLARPPIYVKRMSDEGVRFKLNKKEYSVTSRASNLDTNTVKEFIQFYKRTLGDARNSSREPLILWANYSSEYDEKSVFSEIWLDCFETILIPYDRRKRLKSLKKKVPLDLE
jgi:hypothetical protein